jgi:hypothetical protein
VKLSECKIVGAITLPRGKAAFDRANVILSTGKGYLEATTYLDGDEVTGKPFTREEMLAIVRAGQAIQFAGFIPAATGAVLWVLRSNFEGREAALEELRKSGCMLYEYIKMIDGSFACLVREQPAMLALRDRWTAASDERARHLGRQGDWEAACKAAMQAVVLERVMIPDRIAMISLAWLKLNNQLYADGYVSMARNSRGEEFAHQVLAMRAELDHALSSKHADGPRGKVVGMSEGLKRKSARPARSEELYQKSRESMGDDPKHREVA